MELSQRGVFHGPNPYAPDPVLVADVSVGEAISSKRNTIVSRIEDFSCDWFESKSTGGAGSDPEALVDFVLRWAHCALICVNGSIDVAGYRRLNGASYRTWIGFHRPEISRSALTLGVGLANAAAEASVDPEKFMPLLERLWADCRRHHPDIQAQIVMEAAKADDCPFQPAWGVREYWQFGWGARSEVIYSSASNRDGYPSSRVIGDKRWSKALIEQLGLPTPRDVLIMDDAGIPRAVETVGFPCVVKPVGLGSGRGVSANIRTIQEAHAAFRYARQYFDGPIMVEAFAEGCDHRIMVAEGRVVGVLCRDVPFVTGDGKHTVGELTAELNRGRAPAGAPSITRLVEVVLDDAAVQHLVGQELSPDSVPAAGRRVSLRGNANVSTGGSCNDVTDDIHPDVRDAAEAMARTLYVNMVGFDYMTTDISRSWREVSGTFIEINLTPSLEALTIAGRMSPAEAGRLALGGNAGRIPLDLVIVPDEALAEAENRLSELLPDRRFGWASHNRAQLGQLPLLVRMSHPWSAVLTLLSHRLLESAVVVVASGYLRRHGLPVDRASRIWLFDHDLHDVWREVLRRSSHAPVSCGEWADFESALGMLAKLS